jgi:hypothetical protein
MAIKTRVPVFPVYLDGTQRGQAMLASFLRRQSAQVTFGGPMWLHQEFSPKDLNGATFALRSAVQRLGEEPYRLPSGDSHLE